MTNWQYTDNTNTAVMCLHDDGRMESRSVKDAEIQAWLAEGNIPISAPALTVEEKIYVLERKVTPRMIQEAVSGSTLTFPPSHEFAGMTSVQAIAAIRSQISTLRQS